MKLFASLDFLNFIACVIVHWLGSGIPRFAWIILDSLPLLLDFLIQILSPKWFKLFTVDQWVDLLFYCVWKYVCLFFSPVCWVHICRSKSNSFHSIVDSYITICCHICMINDIFSPTYLVSLWFTFCLHFQFKSRFRS